MKNKRFKLIFNVDRPHIAYDILSVLSDNNIGVQSMEVYTYVVYIKIPVLNPNLEAKIINEWYQIKNLKYIEQVDLLEFGERELEIKEAINKLPNGILIVDNLGYVQYANNFCAERIFNIPIKALKNINIKDFIDEKEYSFNFENLKSQFVRKKQLHIKGADYLVDSTPITVEDNSILGFVISMTELVNINMFKNFITFDDIKTNDKNFRLIIENSKKQAKTNKPIFISGEPGSGKESLARAIHNESSRKNNPFMYIRCDSKPLELLNSYLFNSKIQRNNSEFLSQKTIFEIGNGGTIYFSEIDKLSKEVQIKLIEILQNNSIHLWELGIDRPIDIKFIMSSSQPIDKLISEKQLDKNFLKFLKNSVNIHIPPLRERGDDISLLIDYFFKDLKDKYKVSKISPEALEVLRNYNWPGNIRQLQEVLEESIIESSKKTLDSKDICLKEKNMSLTEIVSEYEKSIIINALKNNDSIRGTARSLNVTHTLLLNRINKYKIQESK